MANRPTEPVVSYFDGLPFDSSSGRYAGATAVLVGVLRDGHGIRADREARRAEHGDEDLRLADFAG